MLAGFVRGVVLRRIRRGHIVEPGGADAEELEHRRHRVRGELAAARAGARARDALELVHVGVASSFPAAAAPTASKTSWIVTSRPRKRPGAIEPL